MSLSHGEEKNVSSAFTYYADSSSVDLFDLLHSHLSSTCLLNLGNGFCIQRKFAYPTSLENYLKFSTSPLPQLLLSSRNDDFKLKPLQLEGRDPTDKEIDRAIAKRAQLNMVCSCFIDLFIVVYVSAEKKSTLEKAKQNQFY